MTAPTTETLAGLLVEATPGPWEASPHAWPEQIGCCPLVGRPFSISPTASAYNVAAATTQTNANLIALAPTLAAEVIALRERVAVLEGAQCFQATHRHVKRGTEYQEMARGKLQTDAPLGDYAEIVAYRGDDGEWWFRAPSEFDDGRFAALNPTEGVE